MEVVIAIAFGLVVGGTLVFFIKKMKDEAQKKSAQIEADKIVNKAKSESSKIERDSKARAKDFEARARKNAEQEIQKQKSQLKNKESQLERRLKELDEQQKSKLEEADRFLSDLKSREEKIEISEKRTLDLEKKVETEIREIQAKTAAVASMTPEQAKRELIAAVEDEAKLSAAKKVQEIEAEAEKEADRRAKRILAVAMARFASEYTSERTVTVLALSGEEMKGKIIGREGRNIRTLESLCGVDVIVDDTPEAVVISGFDPVRRELAKRTIEKLMEDGRVHPARIEEVSEKVKADLNKSLKDEGERVVAELGIGTLHAELLRSIGSMKYRQTHTQNLLNHSMEVANLAGLMAAELGVPVKLAKRAGLLHDIGKTVDHNHEGSHAFVGAEYSKKLGESDAICHAIRAHHNEEPPSSLLAHLVSIANVLSNSRPGARRPGMDSFINRLQELESVGNSFDGVQRTYALQAGREIRVLVEASRVTDDQSYMLARDVARKIEREMPQLGAVKVSVVRETRTVEMAR